MKEMKEKNERNIHSCIGRTRHITIDYRNVAQNINLFAINENQIVLSGLYNYAQLQISAHSHDLLIEDYRRAGSLLADEEDQIKFEYEFGDSLDIQKGIVSMIRGYRTNKEGFRQGFLEQIVSEGTTF